MLDAFLDADQFCDSEGFHQMTIATVITGKYEKKEKTGKRNMKLIYFYPQVD